MSNAPFNYELVANDDRLFQAGNLHLKYRRWHPASSGPGLSTRPPFLLLHGLGSGLRTWDFVAPSLVQATRQIAIAPDQRGHGQSDKPDDGYSTAQFVEDDYALARTLLLDKPIVVGHSWGAVIAFAYAARHPYEVSAVVLVDGVLGGLQERFGTNWADLERQHVASNNLSLTKPQFLDRYLSGIQAPYFTPIWRPALEEAILSTVYAKDDGTVEPRLSRANNLAILRSIWSASLVEDASAIRCPVLIINTEHPAPPDDEMTAKWIQFRTNGAQKLLSALPHSVRAELVVLPDTVHDAPWQRPKEVSRVILDFLYPGQAADRDRV